MTTAYSTNLGLALPVEGELSGTWGDMVNNGITDYLDIAVAGTLTLNGDGAVTLTDTNGDTSSTNIGSTTAQYAVLNITGTLTTTKVITAPSHSKTYVVVNAATGGAVTVKASGQTGVSVAVGEKALIAFNGTDYVKVATSTAVTGAAGSTTQVQYNSSGALAGSANLTFDGTTLTAAGLSGPLNGTVGATTPSTVVATQVNVTAQGDVRFEDSAGGQYVALQAPTTVASNVTFTLPSADGTTGQILQTDGSGNLSFVTNTGISTGKSIAMAMIFGG